MSGRLLSLRHTQSFNASKRRTKSTNIATAVNTLARSFVQPSVYLKPMAHTTSNKPTEDIPTPLKAFLRETQMDLARGSAFWKSKFRVQLEVLKSLHRHEVQAPFRGVDQDSVAHYPVVRSVSNRGRRPTREVFPVEEGHRLTPCLGHLAPQARRPPPHERPDFSVRHHDGTPRVNHLLI